MTPFTVSTIKNMKSSGRLLHYVKHKADASQGLLMKSYALRVQEHKSLTCILVFVVFWISLIFDPPRPV